MGYNNLTNELATNFIEYAAAVNSDRAIPDAKSGLKPVARRILYGAFAHGRKSNKPHVKCARIVGDVMGELHPHGDSSIYGALVRLAQPWVMRYPLIDFHGNMGNIGGDGPAAQRYTEARLSKLSEQGLLKGIKKKNVPFMSNYDETIEEPETLPAIFPNLLCNPNTGIGVAMACHWAPHNLREVGQAIFDYMDGKEPTLPGPDFPTGGVIINGKELPRIVSSGHGSVKIRGKYKIEKNKIIFYEIPYETTIEGLMKELGEVSEKEIIKGISDIRNESNKKGIRIVIECERTASPDAIVQKVFKETNLQTSFSYNQVALVNKTPTDLSLRDCIEIYIEHNRKCIIDEARFDMLKAMDRLEIVNGLLKALEDIDNIIALIKASYNSIEAKDKLILKYQFTENQAKAIIDMKLGKLAGLEKIELQNEKAELTKTIEELDALINTEALQSAEIRTRLTEIINTFGDNRRTEIINIEIKPEEKEIAEVVPEDCVVVLSQSGLIKRVPKSSFKIQKRNGVGAKNSSDAILGMIATNTIDTLMLFSNKGKMYRTVVDNVPVGTNATKGGLLRDIIKLDADESIVKMTSLDRQSDNKYIVFITKYGMVKKSELNEYLGVKKNSGIIAMKLKDGDSVVNIEFMNDEDIILVTKKGNGIRFITSDIKAIGRNTLGVKGITLVDDEVVGGIAVKDYAKLGIFTKNGKGKAIKIDEIFSQGRNGKGVLFSKDEIVSAFGFNDINNLLIVGYSHTICINAKEVPTVSKSAAGNNLIKNDMVKEVMRL